jgi:methyltransferase (TIGR00027 family)
MKTEGISRTAEGAAVIRAIESCRSKRNRLFEDLLARGVVRNPFSRWIIGLMNITGIGTALLALRDRQFPGVIGGLICRTRYIDDALQNALREGFEQVVILGAGFDSRAYRIPGMEKIRVFEVDHPSTQVWKQKCLKRMLGTLPAHVTFVPIDFDKQELEDGMVKVSFRTTVKTFFIGEGVSQYITEEAVDATLRYVSRASAPGSRIVFTYIDRDIIDGSARSELGRNLISLAQQVGEPWLFGFNKEELPRYLAERGLATIEDIGDSDYKERYLKPIGRRLNVFTIERIMLAQSVRSQ